MTSAGSKEFIEHVALILVGDSDISRWPCELYPKEVVQNGNAIHRIQLQVFRGAKSGALIKDIDKQVRKVFKEIGECAKKFDRVIMIACAGENDLSSGISISAIMTSFENTMNGIFSSSYHKDINVIFLGPKVEPWLEDDIEARNGYFQLSQRLKQAAKLPVEDRNDDQAIIFIDCLKMFCGETASLSVVSLSRSAKADTRYFDDDGLHLNNEGYKILKDEVETRIERLLCEDIENS